MGVCLVSLKICANTYVCYFPKNLLVIELVNECFTFQLTSSECCERS